MSNTPPQEPPAQGMSSESGHTLPSRLLQPNSDLSVSKRVCFYKSGDYTFSGHRMVITARTFKTFDALLDALSKKVPLPFGVRTITTPRGTHFVKGLDDLNDGGSYVCSDQKRVKPLNLDEVNRRQVPWNTTRLLSTGRQQRPGPQLGQFGRRNDATKRSTKVNERAVVRTPKRLTVIKNKDPMVRRTIVLQRRTAPTFEALLDYLSHTLQFPVLKLYSTDGRRVDGLAALILCSGVIVAAGNEPFRLGNYSFPQISHTFMETVESSMLQPPAYNNKSFSSGRGSKNFSQSSERYIVNQINASRNGNTNNGHHKNDSFESEIDQRQMSLETCETLQAVNEQSSCILPQDNDIEKSFCVNQDGSMTVEMKVRLTIKEEEMLHWTTTLSRTSLSKRTVCPLVPELGNSSPDSNNAVAKNSSSISEDEAKEENHPTVTERGVGFSNEQLCQNYTSTPLEKTKPHFKRTPTPGPRHVKRKSPVDSVKMATESAVQESTMGHYSYMARTADGGAAEGYCVIRHSSSSSKRPIPRPRKTASAGTNNKSSAFSMKSTGVAEVLQIENKSLGVRETVMHIYESQGCHDSYFANQQYSADSVPLHNSTPVPGNIPSTDSGSHLSSNDCDIDSTWQPPIADSLLRQKEEIFSLSSEPMSPAHKITNDLSSVSANETQAETNSHIQTKHKDKVKANSAGDKKRVSKSARKQNSSSLTSGSEKNQKETIISPLKNSKKSTSDKISSKASVGKKSFTSSESAKSGQNSKTVEKPKIKKNSRDEKTPSKEKTLLANMENVKRGPSKNTSKAALKENGHNVNVPETKTGRSQMKKNISDFLQPKKSFLAGKKSLSKPKSMTENTTPSPKKSLELNESVSMPLLNPSPSEVHQYVENWLEKVSPDAVPYTEETDIYNSEPRKKVVFQIGGDSESEEKSERQSNPEELGPSSDGAIKKPGSCLSVPLCHEDQGTTVVHSQQMARGSCVSMPTFRVELEHQENPLRSHKSAEAIGPVGDESLSSQCNMFNPKEKIKPVLEQISSSMECIRKASDQNLEKSKSYPDFPTQVASVFGSPYKAFLSFVSVMTLRDSLTDASEDSNSEAMLMMESLQKISVIENEEEQRASLTDLQNKASSQFRERWKDFQILRERIESEVMSPKFSETEFALEVTSEGGDVFDENQLGIDELMDELNIPQDLREEITSTIQQVKSFFPTEESNLGKNAKQSPEFDYTHEDENTNEIMSVSEQKTGLVKHETFFDFKETRLRDKSLTDKENEIEGKEVENQVDDGDKQDEDIEEIDDVAQERGKAEQNMCEESNEEVNKEEKQGTDRDEAESENKEEEESIKKVEDTEEEMRMDESEDNLRVEMEVNEEIDDRLTDEGDQDGSEDNSVEETEDREVVEGHTTQESEEEKHEKTMERNNKNKHILGERDEEDEAGESIKERDDEDEMEDSIKEKDEEMEDNIKEKDEDEDEEEEMEDSIKEKDEDEEMEDSSKERDEDEENIDVIEDTEEEEGAQNINEVIEKDVDKETEDTIGERGEEEVTENGILDEDDEERLEDIMRKGGEEEVEDINRDINKEEESKSFTSSEEEQREDSIKEGDEETEGDTQAGDEEEETENITEEREEEEETEDVNEEVEEVDVSSKESEEEETEDVNKEEDEEEVDVSRKGSEEEEDINEGDERELQDNVDDEDGEDVEVKSAEERMITDQEDEYNKPTEDEEESDEGGENRKEMETRAMSVEEESIVKEEQGDNHLKAGQSLDEEEEDDEDEAGCVELSERSDNEVDSLTGGQVCKSLLLEEASYLHQRSSSCDEAGACLHSDKVDLNTESSTKDSSEGQSAKEEDNGTDSVNDLETDEGGENVEKRSEHLRHPVEVSQELLDFVNSALKSSSLIFTYDSQGNIRIEPDHTRTVQTKQPAVRKRGKDSSYGSKCLPSPSTSDLSDYRPESSGSGGYKTQDSLDIVTESGEESSERPFPVCRHSVQKNNIPNRKTSVERASSKQSNTSQSKSVKSFSTIGSATKASKEDLSYFSAASSLKPDSEPAMEAAQSMSFPSEKHSPDDGVLIDHGRWLLKENHLIRKSPPVSIGMYGQLENSSSDATSEDSPTHTKTQHSPLAAISSSELEEMAKPQTPKCTYFNMPHGSDSDPFMDDTSVLSGKNCTNSFKGRGVKVSPTIDTSRTCVNKNGSMSSFASVEFKVPDRKVHPEGESSAVTQARRTSSAQGAAMQPQDSLEALHLRCGQYCPIL